MLRECELEHIPEIDKLNDEHDIAIRHVRDDELCDVKVEPCLLQLRVERINKDYVNMCCEYLNHDDRALSERCAGAGVRLPECPCDEGGGCCGSCLREIPTS